MAAEEVLWMPGEWNVGEVVCYGLTPGSHDSAYGPPNHGLITLPLRPTRVRWCGAGIPTRSSGTSLIPGRLATGYVSSNFADHGQYSREALTESARACHLLASVRGNLVVMQEGVPRGVQVFGSLVRRIGQESAGVLEAVCKFRLPNLPRKPSRLQRAASPPSR
jgi:hypothetical protein